MSIDLSKKKALVTGGNRGIGLATVRALAEAGAEVTFTGRSDKSVADAMNALSGLTGVSGKTCDVTDHQGMQKILAKHFDILINNAGVITPIGRIDEVDIQDWSRGMEINVVGAFYTVQQAIISMQKQGGGTIVNLSSGAARNSMEGWSAYCAGKAALAMITRSVHTEFADKGIRVFGFAPGVVDTDMQVSIRASGMNPVSRIKREDLAPVEQPAHAMAWLCTAAADHLVGQEIDVRDEDFRKACGLEISS